MADLKSYESNFSVKEPEAYTSSADARALPRQKPLDLQQQRLKTLLRTASPSLEEAVESVGVAAAKPSLSPLAVFVVHGMGQQIPFETLDAVAQALRAEEAEQRNIPIEMLDPPEPKPGAEGATRPRTPGELRRPEVREVEMNGEIQRRVELAVEPPDGGLPHPVHIYEAYWAPKTEGKVTLRDVMSFLTGAAVNGIGHSVKPFRRWMFGRQFEFPRSPGNLFVLLGILAVLLALGAMNGIILAVAAAKASYAGFPSWLKAGLFTDLTAAAGIFCLCGIGFGVALAMALFRRSAAGAREWALERPGRWALYLFFLLTCLSAIATAGVMGLLVRGYLRTARALAVENYLGAGGPGILADVVTDACAVLLLALVAGWVVKSAARRSASPPAGPRIVLGGLFYLCLLWFALAAAAVGMLFWRQPGIGEPVPLAPLFVHLPWLGAHWRIWVWALLIGVSAQVRKFLIEYVGDVAAYVTPSKLDRFDEIRNAIRAVALKVAQAIYTATDDHGIWLYDRVVVVGHSLGSVIAYDTLNALINDDLLHATRLDVGSRTKLLLTFGSPLDKIAFLFAAQAQRTSETREALVAAVQPLIQSYSYRTFPWINVHSKNDIISGALDFYDDSSRHEMHVRNEVDPQASIPLAAHTEYWQGRAVWKHLYDTICRPDAAAERQPPG